MGRYLNKVQLIGRLGRDPELRSTQTGMGVASWSMATTETWTKDGEKHEKTEWHNCVAWDKLAVIVFDYARKGSLIYVEGKLQTRTWDNAEGIKQYKTEIKVDTVILLDSKGSRETEPEMVEAEA